MTIKLSSKGGGGYSAGDILHTRANTTASGQTLLPCDGSSLVPAVYPELDALIASGVRFSSAETLEINTYAGTNFSMTPDCTQFISGGDSGTGMVLITYDAGVLSTSHSYTNFDAGLPCLSSSGQVRIMPYIDTLTAGFKCFRTTSGEAATIMDNTPVNINTTNLHMSLAGAENKVAACVCEQTTGANVIALVQSQIANTIYRYKSTDSGATWGAATSITIMPQTGTWSTSRFFQSITAADDLSTIYVVIGDSANAGPNGELYKSTDEGLTFVFLASVSTYSSDVQCDATGANMFHSYKSLYSTDYGTTINYIKYSAMAIPGDNSSIGASRIGAMTRTGSTLAVLVASSAAGSSGLFIVTSLNMGVTWSEPVEVNIASTFFHSARPMFINDAATQVWWADRNNATSSLLYSANTITAKALPLKPGLKIVAGV